MSVGFCCVLIFVNVLGIIIKYLLNIAFLGWVDRVFGILFGITKGILIVSILLIILTAFLAKGAPIIKHSLLAPHVMWVSENMAKVISKDMKRDFSDKLEELKKAFETKDLDVIEPALEKINEAWKVASEELYKAQAEAQQNGSPQSDAGSTSEDGGAGDNVEDVDFEEVK